MGRSRTFYRSKHKKTSRDLILSDGMKQDPRQGCRILNVRESPTCRDTLQFGTERTVDYPPGMVVVEEVR